MEQVVGSRMALLKEQVERERYEGAVQAQAQGRVMADLRKELLKER